jgi:hypothetical protein
MRQQLSFCAVALVLACAFPARAQTANFEASAFVAPSGSYSDYNGLDLDTGLGGGLAWRFRPHWAIEGRFLQRDGDFADVESYQLGLRYAFLNDDARWRPFVVGGGHLNQGDLRHEVVCVTGPCPDREESFDDTGFFAGGGVDWQFNDWFAVRFEGRLLVYDSELYDEIEEDVDLTAGVVFRF